jgi:hypothetical protein
MFALSRSDGGRFSLSGMGDAKGLADYVGSGRHQEVGTHPVRGT